MLHPIFVALAALATLSGTAIVVLIGASVTMRYVANAPFRFTEELVGLLMTATFFLALPLVTLRSEHVQVKAAVAAIPERPRRWVTLVAGFLGLAFCIWLGMLALPWFTFAFERGIKTEVARLLMWPWMVLVPASLALTAIAFVLRGVLDSLAPDT